MIDIVLCALFPRAEGSHTRSKTVVTSSGGFGMLSRFAKKKSTCIGCRAVLDTDGTWGNGASEPQINVCMVKVEPQINVCMVKAEPQINVCMVKVEPRIHVCIYTKS